MSTIKTIYRAATERGSVRLVKRATEQPFAVILDIPHEHAAFAHYAQFDAACAAFTTLADKLRPPIEVAS